MVKLLVAQLAPSAICIVSPELGVAGKVTVNDPPDVFAIILSPFMAV
jgi:hypothetical protein